MRPPNLDEMMDCVDDPGERDRLRRVHDLLVAAGPPPELSPALVTSPLAPEPVEEEPDTSWLPPRRLGAALLVGAALLAGAFGIGYLVGDGGSADQPAAVPAEQPARVVDLRPPDQNDTAGASIRVSKKGSDGNWPMALTVRGLKHLTGGDYYVLALTRDGKPVVTCGTFNVASSGSTTVEMVAAYDLDRFDGWAITEWDSATRSERVLMTET